jgi:hypothetical protein
MRRGSLNTGRRIEQSIATLASLLANVNIKPVEPFTRHDFMPHEDEPELTLEQAMATWK